MALAEVEGSGAFEKSAIGPTLPRDDDIRAVLCPLPSSPPLPASMAASSPSGRALVLAGTRGLGGSSNGVDRTGVGAGKVSVRRGRSSDAASWHRALADMGWGVCSMPQGLPIWLLTAGTDRCVRCWDLVRPRCSFTVCGLNPGQERYVVHVALRSLGDATPPRQP